MEKLQKDLLDNSDKLIFGAERNIKLLKNERLKTIYIANNCVDNVREEIKRCNGSTEVVELDATNNEIRVICKKPFSISVIGLIK